MVSDPSNFQASPDHLLYWSALISSGKYALFPVWHPDHPDHPGVTEAPSTDDIIGDVAPPASLGKRPAISSWQRVKPSQDPQVLAHSLELLQSYGNAGIALTKNQLVIDVDVSTKQKAKKGAESIKRLQADLQVNLVAICSAITMTGSGGLHLYFSLPDLPASVKLRKTIPQYPNIDFLSNGMYVIAPLSTHANGVLYMPLENKTDYLRLTQAPDSLIELLARTKTTSLAPNTENSPTYHDTKENIKRAIAHLQSYPPAVQGYNGDDRTYKAIAIVKDYGVSPVVAFNIVNEVYNPRCVPPWSLPELETKVGNVYQYTAPDAPKSAEAFTESFMASAMLDSSQSFDLGIDDLDAAQTQKTPQTEAKSGVPLIPATSNKDVNPENYKPLQQQEAITFIQDFAEAKDWQNYIIVSQRTQQPDYLRGFENICSVLSKNPELSYLIGYNQFTDSIQMLRRAPWLSPKDPRVLQTKKGFTNVQDPNAFPSGGIPWNEADTSQLRLLLARMEAPDSSWTGIPASESTVWQAIAQTAYEHAFDPVQDYIRQAAKRYDGVGRLKTWLARALHLENDAYISRIGYCTIMAIVARNMQPGYKYDQLLVLAGDEGVRKSSFGKAIAANPDYFSDTKFDYEDPRQLAERIKGVLVKEEAELVSFSKASAEAFKAILSSERITSVRMAYSRTPQTLYLRNIFFGTTNMDEFIRVDDGTARRIWPVTVTKTIDTDWIRDNIEQLYGEAYIEFLRFQEERKPLILDLVTDEEKAIAKKRRNERREHNMLLDLVEEYINSPDHPTRLDFVTTREIATFVLNLPPERSIGRSIARQIAVAFTALGWKAAFRKPNGVSVRGYKRPAEDVLAKDQALASIGLEDGRDSEVLH